MWGESPGGSFAVDQQSLLLPVHHVLLHFGDVVRNVIDDMHVQVVRRGAKHFREGLKNKVLNDQTFRQTDRVHGRVYTSSYSSNFTHRLLEELIKQ